MTLVQVPFAKSGGGDLGNPYLLGQIGGNNTGVYANFNANQVEGYAYIVRGSLSFFFLGPYADKLYPSYQLKGCKRRRIIPVFSIFKSYLYL